MTVKLENLLCNNPVPLPLQQQFLERLLPDEQPLFALVGDMRSDATYGDTALLVTDRRILCVDETSPNGGFSFERDPLPALEVKRLYGNAILLVDKKIALRFSFALVAFMEAAVSFLEAVRDGADTEQELETFRYVLEKERSTCPKCGRNLPHPGAVCIHCMGKGKLLRRLWEYISLQKGRLLFSLLLSMLTAAAALVPPYITKLLVDEVIPDRNLKLLFMVVGVLFGVYLAQNVLGAIRAANMRLAGDRIVEKLRNDVYSKAQYLPVEFYDKTSSGSMFSRISGDAGNINTFILRITQEGVVHLFQMIGIMIIMLALNWELALLSLLPVPLVAIGARLFSKQIKPRYRRIWQRWSSVLSVLSDSLPGIRVIKTFTGEGRAIEKFRRYNAAWFSEEKRAIPITSIFPHAVTFFITCGSLLIWGVGGQWVINGTGDISLGLLVSFISYAGMFYTPVNFFANLSDTFQQTLTSAERLLDILDAEPEKNFGAGHTLPYMKGRIEFRHVCFSFDKTTRTLDDINLVIEPGDIVGIVGTTGSGKSTLINLLMRFYDDYEGQILVDGKDIRTIDLASYRSLIGFVQQDPLMFRDTVFQNIAFSKPDAQIEEVIHAADVANAHGFIAKMPDAYDTVLGERGAGLSGGERQRLSIARAVLKNPSVLIFDEATAAVDSETEHLIQDAIERLIVGRTTLMIAHRLSTLRRANKIVVVDKGRIIEFGSHDELMALNGKYRKLIEIQNVSEEIRRRNSEERFE